MPDSYPIIFLELILYMIVFFEQMSGSLPLTSMKATPDS
jgi:hypothetical protein